MQKPSLVIGTRGSKLALTQSETVAAELRRLHPDLTVELQIISTKGDRILDRALSAVGDKGLFVTELEQALSAGQIDLAVHSCKDMPSFQPDDLVLAAFPERADPRDAVVLPGGGTLDDLKPGAIVGSSSLRRACQLQALRPDLDVRNVRGNVDTRLRKLHDGEYDALILACAGLDRLGLSEQISQRIAPELMLPAVAQGALAIETRKHDSATRALLEPLDDAATRAPVLAERALLRSLEGGCQVPIAAYAELTGQTLRMRGLVGTLDGQTIMRAELSGPAADPVGLGTALAERLLADGAAAILDALRGSALPSVTRA
jgi:hydroxymethylbilane synthase